MASQSCLIGSVCAVFLFTCPGYAADSSHVILSDGHPVVQASLPPLNLDDKARHDLITNAVSRKTHQATPKDFKPAEGARVPSSLHILAFPPDTEPPELRQYAYAHLDREILVIDALMLEIVLVIPLPEDKWTGQDAVGQFEAQIAWAGGMQGFTDQQRAAAYQYAVSLKSQPGTVGASGISTEQGLPRDATIRAGVEIPESITLTPFPTDMALPQQNLAFANLRDGRVIFADATTRRIVGIVARNEVPDADDKSPGSRDPLKHLEESGSGSAYTSPNEKR